MKRINRILLILSLLFLLLPLQAHAETLEERLNNLVGPAKQYNTKLSPVFIRNNTLEESISAQSGEIKLMQTDYLLPGTNGLDLEIKRIYKSGVSNVQEMKVKYVNGAWVDYVHSDAKTSSFYEDRYNIGVGMRFSFPSMEIRENQDKSSHKFLHTEGGDVYRLRAVLMDDIVTYMPEGQTVRDVIIRESNDFNNGQGDGESKYVMSGKDGKKTYFSEDGRILGIVDRYGNTIKFEYTTLSYEIGSTKIEKRLIGKIIDSVGRVVTLEYKEDHSFRVGKIKEVPYSKEDSYKASQNPNTVDSGDLEEKFQVEITFPGGKKIVYDKSAVLVNPQKQVIRTRLQRVYDVDGQPKYHYWYEQPELGFTYTNGKTYSVYNRYENLVQIDYLKNNRIKRYSYDSFTQGLSEGSMQYRKIVEVQELVKKDFDNSHKQFIDKFITETKDRVTYTYVNEPDGFGHAGYKENDYDYLENTYRYETKITDLLGGTQHYSYDGIHQLIEIQDVGEHHKEVTYTEHDEMKLVKLSKRLIYPIVNGQPSSTPTTEITNYKYDEYGNLTNYTGKEAKRDENGIPLNNEHTVVYSYDYDRYHMPTSKTWKRNPETLSQVLYTLNNSGDIIQETKINTQDENQWVIIYYEYDEYGNMIKRENQSKGETYSSYYEYGVDAKGQDHKGAYMTKTYQIFDGERIERKYSYDFNTGNLLEEIDPLGNVTTFEYDSLSRLINTTKPNGGQLPVSYRDQPYQDFAIEETDALGNRFLYEYDILGYLVRYSLWKENQWQRLETNEYDSKGNLLKQIDANGHSIRYTYDSASRLISKGYYEKDQVQKGELSLKYEVGYDENTPLRLVITDEEGYKERYYYDVLNQLIKKEYSADKINYYSLNYTYDYEGNLIEFTDGGGATSYTEYDDLGRKVVYTDPLGYKTHYEYNGLNQELKIHQPDGRIVENIYDEIGRLSETKIYLEGSEEYCYSSVNYDLNGNIISQIEGMGDGAGKTPQYVLEFSYDSMNQRTDQYEKIDEARKSHKEFKYDLAGNLLQVLDFSDAEKTKYIATEYAYDFAGRQVKEIIAYHDVNNAAEAAQYGYSEKHLERDMEGNITKELVFTGDGFETTHYAYNYRNLVTEIKEPFSGQQYKVTQYQYDQKGNLTAETIKNQGKALTTAYIYNGQNQVLTKTNPLGQVHRYAYDANGNKIKEVDPRYINMDLEDAPGMVYEYDQMNQGIKDIDFDGTNSQVVTYREYDGRGNIVKEVSGEGYNNDAPEDSFGTLMKYDALNRVIEKTSAQTAAENLQRGTTFYTTGYQYDFRGNVLSETDSYGNTTYSTYYLNGLLKEKTYPDESRELYDYDLTGLLYQIKINRGGNKTEQWNTIFQTPFKVQFADGTTQIHQYSPKGELIAQRDQAGNWTYYEYDQQGNQTAIREYIRREGNTEFYKLTQSTYDERGLKLSKETFLQEVNGELESVVSANDLVHFTYDNAGRLIKTSGPLDQEVLQEYDAQGNVITITEAVSATEAEIKRIKYDHHSRVTSESILVKTSEIDSRFLAGATFDDFYFDRIMATTTYQYNKDGQPILKRDANGNQTQVSFDLDGRPVKRVSAEGDIHQYFYDRNGNLIEECNGNSAVTQYQYDAFNQLIRKIEPAQSGIAVTAYIYDVMGNVIKVINPNEYQQDKDTPELVQELKGTTYTYDSMNRKVTTYSPEGVLLEYILYNELGMPQKVINGLGYTGELANSLGTTYTYDGLGKTTTMTDPLGAVTSFQYDVLGNLVKRTNPKGHITTWVYSSASTMDAEKHPDGSSKWYTYDRKGRKISETDERGYVTTYRYSSLGKLLKVEDPYQNTRELKYDLSGNLISEKDKRGSISYFSYDKTNRLTQKRLPLQLDAAGNTDYLIEDYQYDSVGNLIRKKITSSKDATFIRETSYTYYDNNKVETVSDNNGAYSKSTYDLNGNLVELKKAKNDKEFEIERYQYDSLNRQITKIQLVNAEDIYEGDKYSHLIEETTGKLQLITQYQYDPMGNKITETNPKGDQIKYRYDLLGQVIEITRDLDGQEVSQHFDYDANGNRIKSTDEKGNETKYHYDTMNRLLTIIDPMNQPFTFEYDLAGNKITETNSLGYKMTYEYDQLNRLQIIKDPLNKIIRQNEYDENGNLVKYIDGKGYETLQFFDLANRVIKKIDPEANEDNKHTAIYQYLPTGELIKETDAYGHSMTYQYDNGGRLQAVTDQLGVTTRYGYDLIGNKLFMQDGRGKVTKYHYGALGFLIEVINSENQSINYQYDLTGNLALEIDKSRNHIQYTYDSRNLLTKKQVLETGDQITYSYDEAGNRQTMEDESGETTYYYDEKHQLIEKRKNGELEIAYEYNSVGNLITVTDNKGFTTGYTYDESNRMKTVTFNNKTVTYEYDENGNRKSIQYPGGIREEYILNKNNRLIELTNKSNKGSILSSYQYTYDLTGKETSKTDSYGTTNYTYDTVGRVTKVEAPGKTTHYSYDKSGNRLTMDEIYTSPQPSGYIDQNTKEAIQYKIKKSHYVYTNANKLIKLVEKLQDEEGEEVLQKTTNYQYDANGNEVRQAVNYILPHNRQMRQSTTGDIHGDQQTEEINILVEKVNSQYDGFNRPKEIEKIKDGERVVVSFTYNGDGLRTQKISKSSKDNYNPVYTNYHYDRQHVILETNERGAVSGRYIRGNNYISRYDSNNQLVYYLYNGHGDVVQTITEAGEIQNQYDYDIFGNPTLQIEQHQNPIRYAGEFYDQETGLYYLRARYYNPYTGRFISEDSYWGETDNPLSLNLYTYAYNDPIKFIDPSGHSPRTIADIIAEIDQAKRDWMSDEDKRDKTRGKDGWTPKQILANKRANKLREELASLDNSAAARNLANKKGDDAGSWEEYKRKAYKKEVEKKGKTTSYTNRERNSRSRERTKAPTFSYLIGELITTTVVPNVAKTAMYNPIVSTATKIKYNEYLGNGMGGGTEADIERVGMIIQERLRVDNTNGMVSNMLSSDKDKLTQLKSYSGMQLAMITQNDFNGHGWVAPSPNIKNTKTGESGNMQVSQNLIEFIKQYETFEPEAYRGQDSQNQTIGFGHVIQPGEEFGTITIDEAEALLRKDLQSRVDYVNQQAEKYDLELNQHQFDGLVDMVFNKGNILTPEKATFFELIVKGSNDTDEIFHQFARWNKVNGEFSLGVYRRSTDAADIFLYGEYGRDYRETPDKYE